MTRQNGLELQRVPESGAVFRIAAHMRATRRPLAQVHAHRDVELFGQGEIRLELRVVEAHAAILRADLGEHGKVTGREVFLQLGGCTRIVGEERDRRDHAAR